MINLKKQDWVKSSKLIKCFCLVKSYYSIEIVRASIEIKMDSTVVRTYCG